MQYIRLGDIASIAAGQGAPQGAENYSEYGTPFVKAGNLAELTSGTSEDAIQKVSDEVAAKHKLKLFPQGTVLFAKSGMSCMKGYVYTLSRDCYVVSHLACITPHTVESEYLKYYFEFHRPNQLVKDAAYPSISLSDIAELPIAVFDQEKRQEIIHNLDVVSGLIEKKQQILSLMDLAVKSRFIELFGDPDTNPLGWNEDVLSEHLEVIGGYAFKSDKFEDEGIPVLRIGNINSGRFLPVNMVYWNDDPALERYKMYPGDLVMSLTGTVGKDDYGNVCILGADYPEYYLNQRNAKLSLKTTLNAKYLSELLKFERIKRRLTGISRGVRQANISNKDILCLCVPIAPINIQQQFASFVEQTDKSKLAVQKALEELEILKKSLMQQYFG